MDDKLKNELINLKCKAASQHIQEQVERKEFLYQPDLVLLNKYITKTLQDISDISEASIVRCK